MILNSGKQSGGTPQIVIIGCKFSAQPFPFRSCWDAHRPRGRCAALAHQASARRISRGVQRGGWLLPDEEMVLNDGWFPSGVKHGILNWPWRFIAGKSIREGFSITMFDCRMSTPTCSKPSVNDSHKRQDTNRWFDLWSLINFTLRGIQRTWTK